MGGDGGTDEIAAEAPQTRECTILLGAGEPAVADHVRDQDRRELSGLGHGALRQRGLALLPPRFLPRKSRSPRKNAKDAFLFLAETPKGIVTMRARP